MAKGEITSPFSYRTADYLGRVLSIEMPFDDTQGVNGAILNGTLVHRDPGCLYVTIVFATPSTPQAKRLPDAPEGDSAFTAQQVRIATGFQTYADVLASGQITAET